MLEEKTMAETDLSTDLGETLCPEFPKLAYLPQDGIFIWRQKTGRGNHIRLSGDQAGTATKNGYRSIIIGGVSYYEHRLAWFFINGKWPDHQIDHINMMRSDNRETNLREATNAQNKQNSKIHADNKSGYKGIYYHSCGKWHATIMALGRKKSLGYFDTPASASAAYEEAASREFGKFWRQQ